MPSESAPQVGETAVEDGSEPEPTPLETIEWGPVRHDRLRSIAVGAGLAILLSIAWIVGVVVVAAARTALSGGLALGNAWVFVVLALVGGPLSVVYLLVGIDRSTPESRRTLHNAFGDYSLSPSTLRPGWVLGGAAALGAVTWAGPAWIAAGSWALLPMIWIVPMIAGSRGTSVRLDPVDRVVRRTSHTHDRTRTDDLNAVVRTRRVDLPWTTVFLLAFRGNEWYRSTPWLFVPTESAAAVERTLDAVLARSDGPDRASVPERAVLALVGGSSLIVGIALVVAGAGEAGWALAFVASPLSLVFLALAARL
ncbi:hypothetical protein [Halorubrum sp. DTA98]|uniref:hypothetical protein n=1 Tax=Halorubrum sp. DTA98 TaxID=3402163 RepID=UPI003AAF4560